MTIRNTKPEFYWLTNYLETLLSCQLWQTITSATIAAEYWKILSKYAKETTGSTDFVQWQGHDFSMRGMSSVESAILSGMGHLTSFTGTDTIPAIYAMRSTYRPDGLIGASVPATEHSVECMGGAENMLQTLLTHLKEYPTGILSKVMDTWDLTQVVKPAEDGILVQAKGQIIARDGKLVIRPDSCPKGLTPADILCGHEGYLSSRENQAYYPEFYSKGLIECLWEIFGGTVNKQGYKELDPHIGAIYGDSISLEIAEDVCKRLKDKGFASTNVVFGIGSYTYQYNTRDTFGFAVKATYGEVLKEIPKEEVKDGQDLFMIEEQKDGSLKFFDPEPREIFKDPITDDGTKKSLKGLISVQINTLGELIALDQQTWEQEATGYLETVYLDGKIVKEYTLNEIRKRIQS